MAISAAVMSSSHAGKGRGSDISGGNCDLEALDWSAAVIVMSVLVIVKRAART
jgi:hypothetical protein